MESSVSTIALTPEQLEQFSERASRLVASVKWQSKSDLFQSTKTISANEWRESSISQNITEELSLLKIAHIVSRDALLLTADVNYVLLAVREGLKIAMLVSKNYTKFSGLDQLIEQNARGGLADKQKTEFRSKYHTASAITVFVGAYYILWNLLQYKAEQVGAVKMEFTGLPEVSLQDPVRALDCLVYYQAAFLEKSGLVRTDLDFVKLSILYYQSVVDEIKLRVPALEYIEPYTAQNFKLQNSEFCLKGFEIELRGGEASVEFNRVELKEIVGNKEAKHDCRRLAMRLLCYDMKEKKNPFCELGGLASVTMGYGEAGTGKSMLIAALATMLSDYCKNLGYQFLFWPMPDTVVSTYQGGSAERMLDWMKPLRDTSKIIYAPIDDAENNLEERSRQGVSAGVREVISVFLRNTEGAYAINRGNAVIQLFTNLPDQIDKAVLSRINLRSYIGGARNVEDFLDQDYLWHKKYAEIDPKFVNQMPPKNYVWLEAQAQLSTLTHLPQGKEHETEITDILEKLNRDFSPENHSYFAELFKRVQERYPHFTSRDVRNIQRAIDARILDFDLPEEWFEKTENYAEKSYQTKMAMIIEIMKGELGKLSFADIRLRETLNYLDNMARIADAGKEREISELVSQLELRNEAEKRFSAKVAC